MSEESVRFSGAGLELEGILHLPQGDGPFPGVVMCHPHPQYGGDMFNNIVLAICYALVEASVIAFRFNFRGVGASQGNLSDGIGEQDDVKAALAFLSSIGRVDSARIGLAGYSFGSIVAFPVSLRDERVQALALISPLLSSSGWEQLKSYPHPKFLLWGSKDFFVSAPDIPPEFKQWEVIPGADHFWWGYERKVAEKVSAFFSIALSG
jgi:hypothetical protein